MEEFVEDLEKKIRFIRRVIRKFYRDFPKYSPMYRGKSKEEIDRMEKVRSIQQKSIESLDEDPQKKLKERIKFQREKWYELYYGKKK